MKPLRYTLIALAAACGFANAQTTAYTTPVGYVSLGDITPGQPAVKGMTDVSLCVPLDRTTSYAGVVASVGANTITFQGTPGFTVGQFTAQPNVIKLTSGPKEGFYALITGNTADTVTVSLPPGQDLTSVVAGNSAAIGLAWTAKAFFAGTTLPADAELYQFSGVAPGINPSADFVYVWDGTDWIDGGSGEAVDPILYPGETFILRNTTNTTIPSIVVTGQVPTSKFTNVLQNYGAGQQDLPLALFTPVDQSITQSGLATVAVADDEVYFVDNAASGINKSASVAWVFDGTEFLDAGSGEPVDKNAMTFKAGQGFTIRRATGAPGTLYSYLPSYVPSL